MSATPSLLIAGVFIALSLGSCGKPSPADSSDPSTSSAADSLAGDPARPFTAWQVGSHPESVTIHGARVYVTQFGPALEPTVQDGDGYIAVYDANGQLLDTLGLGLDAPKGSEMIGDILYVADVDTVFGFNTSTGAITFARALPGNPQFLNGLAATSTGELYVSATDVGKIWRIEPASGKITEVAQLPGVNGLAVDISSGDLYAVVYPQTADVTPGAYRVDPVAGTTTRIGQYGGVLDGVAIADGQLYTTDWNPAGAGRIVAIDLATGASRILAEDATFTGPADFDMLGDGLALIPMLLEDRVVAVLLK